MPPMNPLNPTINTLPRIGLIRQVASNERAAQALRVNETFYKARQRPLADLKRL